MTDLIERLRNFDWRGKIRTATAHEAADRIAALIAAGDKLAGYARHNYACGAWWEEGRICDCGYTEAVKAWKEARDD